MNGMMKKVYAKPVVTVVHLLYETTLMDTSFHSDHQKTQDGTAPTPSAGAKRFVFDSSDEDENNAWSED